MHTNHLNLPEKQQAIWDQAKLKYKDPVNPLSSYKWYYEWKFYQLYNITQGEFRENRLCTDSTTVSYLL